MSNMWNGRIETVDIRPCERGPAGLEFPVCLQQQQQQQQKHVSANPPSVAMRIGCVTSTLPLRQLHAHAPRRRESVGQFFATPRERGEIGNCPGAPERTRARGQCTLLLHRSSGVWMEFISACLRRLSLIRHRYDATEPQHGDGDRVARASFAPGCRLLDYVKAWGYTHVVKLYTITGQPWDVWPT